MIMKPSEFTLDISSLSNDYETIRRCSAMLEYEDDFIFITAVYGTMA